MNDPNPYASPMAKASSAGSQWAQTDSKELSNTSLGLTIVYYGIVLILLGFIGAIVAAFAMPQLVMVAGALVIIGSILTMVGPLCCLSVPAATGAKGFVIASVVLQLVNLCATGLNFAGVVPPAIVPVTAIFGVLSAICFVLFMRKLSFFISRTDLGDRATRVLMVGIVALVLTVVTGVLAVITPAAAILGLVIVGLFLIAFVMYANVVDALRKALKSPNLGKKWFEPKS